jgi:hypothetical protein
VSSGGWLRLDPTPYTRQPGRQPRTLDDPPPPIPADREARERLAVRLLAQEIRACRGVIPASGAVVGPALEAV